MTELPSIAVIADAHFHDIDSDYDGATTLLGTRRVTLRSWKDTRKSSRVFNESAQALRTALSNIHQQGIRHVVLLGDYTDDGQIEATARLVDLLKQYRREYGLAFYAIPGNHDYYGPEGKHQSTRFVTAPDSTVLVTSDAETAATEEDTSVLTRKIYCEGSPASLAPMAEFGLSKQAEYLYWETPFGQSDLPESRMFDARSPDGKTVHRLMDASYLVEPSNGLWLLMIDANVFEPRNGRTDPSRKSTFRNSSDAGWNALLRVKPFLIDWIRDVCARARQLNKELYAFSHYPIIDSLDDHAGHEARLFGNTENIRRSPISSVASALTDAGLNIHFSGHMHVNATTQRHQERLTLTDVAVPSLSAFPPCYKIVQPGVQSCTIKTVAISDMAVDPMLMTYYRAECDAANEIHDLALSASSYGEFLYRRMRSRTVHHYLFKDWPQDIASKTDRTTVADLVLLLLMQGNTAEAQDFGPLHETASKEMRSEISLLVGKHDLNIDDVAACSMTTLISDWYCLRHAGPIAKPYIKPANLQLYQFLVDALIDLSIEHSSDITDSDATKTHAEFFLVFISVLKQAMQDQNQSSTMTLNHTH